MTVEMIRQYSLLVDFLGRTLGPDYEIALHDLGKKQSIVAIANGHISGRAIGAPLTNVAMQNIAERNYETQNYYLSHRGLSADGRLLRSSSFYIKDEHGKLVGLLCINFDDTRYQQLSELVFSLCHPDEYAEKNISIGSSPLPDGEDETFYSSIASAADAALLSVMKSSSVPTDRLTQDEKMEIVGLLNSKGIFMLKGAVTEVAERLSCSPASIYRYLGKLNRKKNS
ncbi:MAG: PAS domain-containing protein [Lachnospiraceae bacterium]|nr:PAS domain-containing protein [Lachnospiraceae bacterium]